ncbi:MAG: hypothetical protein EXX96DRAFT_463494, partial [Benjaminiella poitrasii]
VQPILWRFFLSPVTDLDLQMSDAPLCRQFINLRPWKRFFTKRYRRIRAPHSNHLFPPITSSSLHTFWSVTIHLPARAVWYPVLYRKIPTSSFLSNLQLTSSNICRLCNAAIDTLDHFIVLCPLKLPIWSSLLQTAFPDVTFAPDAILQLLLYLQPP